MKHWTPEVAIQAVACYAKLTEAQIRKRQRLCDLQIVMAFEARDDDAINDLNAMRDALTAEMLRRLG
jgi:hypothetical protein